MAVALWVVRAAMCLHLPAPSASRGHLGVSPGKAGVRRVPGGVSEGNKAVAIFSQGCTHLSTKGIPQGSCNLLNYTNLMWDGVTGPWEEMIDLSVPSQDYKLSFCTRPCKLCSQPQEATSWKTMGRCHWALACRFYWGHDFDSYCQEMMECQELLSMFMLVLLTQP